MPTTTGYAKINLALFAAAMFGGCAQSVAPLPIASADQACERTMAVLVANRSYPADQMVGCDGGTTDENAGHYVLRVNGVCNDPQGCGSVLMGWYAVEASTGVVYDWDVAELEIGKRIDRQE